MVEFFITEHVDVFDISRVNHGGVLFNGDQVCKIIQRLIIPSFTITRVQGGYLTLYLSYTLKDPDVKYTSPFPPLMAVYEISFSPSVWGERLQLRTLTRQSAPPLTYG